MSCGFVRTLPPPVKPRLSGAGALQAWVRAGLDWVGLGGTGSGQRQEGQNRSRPRDPWPPSFACCANRACLPTSGRQKSHQAAHVIPVKGPAPASPLPRASCVQSGSPDPTQLATFPMACLSWVALNLNQIECNPLYVMMTGPSPDTAKGRHLVPCPATPNPQ